MKMTNWTKEQREAVNRSGENILVAAGAGSGKTRVLVERVIKQILAKDNPLDIDKILVVTFTNAAAAEMRRRISKALEEAIKNNPYSAHLRRQMLLLNRAAITTLHSFCREVLQKYYYVRDLDPSGRILDDTEGVLLRQEVLEEVLEEYYEQEKARSPFYRLLDTYSRQHGDEAVQELVHRLYNFSRSQPWPEKWLEGKVADFSLPVTGLVGTEWLKIILADCSLEIDGILSQLVQARELAVLPTGPEPYLANLEAEVEMLSEVKKQATGHWQEFQTAISSVVFARLPACKKDDFNPDLAEKAKKLRDAAKKSFNELKGSLFVRSLDEMEEELHLLKPLMATLVEVVNDFSKKYKEIKREKGLLDFADLEHFALQILSTSNSSPRRLLPSEAALDYQQRFSEVLTDEYQDTSMVQEAILQLVSQQQEEYSAGNRFMVGDVKQSIYRFRLAEPSLFQKKMLEYGAGASKDKKNGSCIILAHNFRSRREILTGVNFLFRQIMDETVGEINYEEKDCLLYGAPYPEKEVPVEVLFISREKKRKGEDSFPTGEEGEDKTLPEEEWEKAALEGRLIARKIKELVGLDTGKPVQLYDKEKKEYRPATFRDIVILLRSMESYGSAMLEELKLAGIPVYAEMGKGYFKAIEIEVMLSLFQIIDNPYQDIPLAAVLRSPLVGLKAEELALLRLADPQGPYYEAVKKFLDDDPSQSTFPTSNFQSPTSNDATHHHPDLKYKVREFLAHLQTWQRSARQGSLADLIWQIYRETSYYDLVGAMSGGNQRQANLRALYDRARQYEATSFRGLFRFLRFIEKLKERGGDLGVARALGEKEDVVRLLTIHKSKGLEFPVVFLAGLSKRFNMQDLSRSFLLHKDLGFGPRCLDTNLRVSYPSLPFLAVKKKLKWELLAEEMRILYVALTRAEERLFLMAVIEGAEEVLEKWRQALPEGDTLLLSAHYRAKAKSHLDWLGPALLRHPQANLLREAGNLKEIDLIKGEKSSWLFDFYKAGELIKGEDDNSNSAQESYCPVAEKGGRTDTRAFLGRFEPISSDTKERDIVAQRLSWSYPYPEAPTHLAKISVSEVKKSRSVPGEEEGFALNSNKLKNKLKLDGTAGLHPRFLGEEPLSSAEKGTVYHLIMQHLSFAGSEGGVQDSGARNQALLKPETIESRLQEMLSQDIISPAEKEVIDVVEIAAFFQSPLGQRLLQAKEVWREVSFSLALSAEEIYPDWKSSLAEEKVLLQGTIDCLFREKNGSLVLLDYKTDRTKGLAEETLKERYREQLTFYARAIEDIWQEEVKEKYLYFFDRQLILEVG